MCIIGLWGARHEFMFSCVYTYGLQGLPQAVVHRYETFLTLSRRTHQQRTFADEARVSSCRSHPVNGAVLWKGRRLDDRKRA